MAEQTLTDKVKAARAIFASLTPEQHSMLLAILESEAAERPKRGRPPNSKAIPEQASLPVEEEA